MTINIKAPANTTIPVELVGKKYNVTPPKAAFSLRLAIEAKQGGDQDPEQILKMMTKWVEAAFSRTNATAILKRLEEPKDALDYSHLSRLMEAIVEEQTKNPTT